MTLELGLTDELTNTQFATVAALAAYYEAQNALEPLQSVTSAQKKGVFTLKEKLTLGFLSLLAGCEHVSEINVKLRPERNLAQVYRIGQFADQSTLSRALDGLTQMNLGQLETAVTQINARCSRARQHDWRGFLLLDFDLSGLICGKQARGSTKGHFSGKKTQLGVS